MSEGASPAGFSASLGNSVNEERSCARKPNNIVVNASRNRLARKPYAGNPHVRFEEGEGSSRTLSTLLQTLFAFFCVPIGHQPAALTPVTTNPTGRICWGYLSRHFVPGYDRSVPTGRGS